jgi:putative endonuclease
MKQMDNRTDKRRLGDGGEELVVEHLSKNGYKILERNYLRKWGELDIVAQKDEILHFIEVKSVSRDTDSFCVNPPELSAGRETEDEYRPEDNMHPWKLQRLRRIIQTYLLDKDDDIEWQFDLATVYIAGDKHKIHFEEDVII